MPFIPFGALQIPTFFLVISISLTVLLFFLSHRVDHLGFDRRTAFDISLLLMIAGFTGGRLLHVFYEEWPYYRENPERILYFWNGGFVFFGGLIFCVVAGYAYARIRKISFPRWADFFAPLLSLGHALGRVGCLMSGCCYGTYCTLPWAYDGRHPTVLYMIFAELAIFAVLLLTEKRRWLPRPGSLLALWLLLHSAVRFWVEYYRDDFRGVFLRLPLFGSLSISQLISLAVIFVCLVFFARFRVKRLFSAIC